MLKYWLFLVAGSNITLINYFAPLSIVWMRLAVGIQESMKIQDLIKVQIIVNAVIIIILEEGLH